MTDEYEHVEEYTQLPLFQQFAYSPADQEALDRRDASKRAAQQAAMAIENAMRTPSVDDTLTERNAIHGDFTDDAATAQALKYVMRQGKNWDDMPPWMREALDQMQTKVARVLAGDYRHRDHWTDLQGYPRLVEQRL